MNYQIQLSELDRYLIDVWRREGRPADSGRLHPAISVDGALVHINAAAILRVVIRGRMLDDLDDPDADIEPHLADARGSLKGGKMAKRDKRFGLSDDFWDWWHRVGKPRHGRDVESKEEADHWHRIYEDARALVHTSWFVQSLPSLTFSERTLARRRLMELATDMVLGAL